MNQAPKVAYLALLAALVASTWVLATRTFTRPPAYPEYPATARTLSLENNDTSASLSIDPAQEAAYQEAVTAYNQKIVTQERWRFMVEIAALVVAALLVIRLGRRYPILTGSLLIGITFGYLINRGMVAGFDAATMVDGGASTDVWWKLITTGLTTVVLTIADLFHVERDETAA